MNLGFHFLSIGFPLATPFIQQGSLLLGIDALDGPKPAYIACQRDAFIRLQSADEMPFNGWREQARFLEEFLQVVFAKVGLRDGGFVQGQDVGGRFEFGDGD